MLGSCHPLQSIVPGLICLILINGIVQEGLDEIHVEVLLVTLDHSVPKVILWQDGTQEWDVLDLELIREFEGLTTTRLQTIYLEVFSQQVSIGDGSILCIMS